MAAPSACTRASPLRASIVSAARSLPARSTRVILPSVAPSVAPSAAVDSARRTNCTTAWLRDERSLTPLLPVRRTARAVSSSAATCSASAGLCSVRPTSCTCMPFSSGRHS